MWEAQQQADAGRSHCPEEERGEDEDERKEGHRAGDVVHSGDDVFVRTSNVKKYTLGKHEAIARTAQPSLCGVVVRLVADNGEIGPGTITIRPDTAIITTLQEPLLSDDVM